MKKETSTLAPVTAGSAAGSGGSDRSGTSTSSSVCASHRASCDPSANTCIVYIL